MGGMKLGPIVYEKKGKSKSNNGPFVGTIPLKVPGTLYAKLKVAQNEKWTPLFSIKKLLLPLLSVSEIFLGCTI